MKDHEERAMMKSVIVTGGSGKARRVLGHAAQYTWRL
jgi:hypothetical protein